MKTLSLLLIMNRLLDLDQTYMKVTKCQRRNVKIKYVICDKLGGDLYLLGILKKMFVIFNDFSYNIDDCF